MKANLTLEYILHEISEHLKRVNTCINCSGFHDYLCELVYTYCNSDVNCEQRVAFGRGCGVHGKWLLMRRKAVESR